MSAKIDLGAPLRVSPFIKFCRYSALIAGIFWGATRYNALKNKEDAHKEYVEKMKPVWDEQLLAQKRKIEREGLLQLAQDCGVPIPADFDEKYPPSN